MTAVRRLRALPSVLLAAAALVAAGCLKADGKTTIAADGSGKIAQTWEIDVAMLEQLIAAIRVMDPSAPAEEDPDVSARVVDWLKGRVKGAKGVEVGTFEDSTKDGKRTVKFDAKFPDLESLAKAGLLGVTGSELTKADDGAFTLKVRFTPPAAETGQFDPAAYAPMFESMLGGLSFKQVVTLPGTVSETNGKKSEDGKTVTFVVGFKELCAGDVAWNVTFKGENLTLKPFKYEKDVMSLVQEFSAATKKKPKEDKPAAPAMGEPAMTEPATTEPAMSEPAMTEPAMTEPAMGAAR